MQLSGIHVIDFAKLSKIPAFNINIKIQDKKRTVKLILTENNKVLNLNDYTITIAAKKNDGTSIFNSVNILNSEEGLCEFIITDQMLALNYDLTCEVVLYTLDGTIASSSNFTINKLPSLRDDEKVESSNEFSALTNALVDVTAVKSQLSKKRDLSVKLKSSDLDISKDSAKIQLLNLSDEVIQAMSGNANVNPVIPKKGVTFEKLADGESYEKQMGAFNDSIHNVEITSSDKNLILKLSRNDNARMTLYKIGLTGEISQAIAIENNSTYTIPDYASLIWDYQTTSIRVVDWNLAMSKDSLVLVTNYDGKAKDGYFVKRNNYIKNDFDISSTKLDVYLANPETLYIYNAYNQFPSVPESNGIYIKWTGLLTISGDSRYSTSREFSSIYNEVGTLNQDQSIEWVQNCIRVRENKSLVINLYKFGFEVIDNSELTKSYYLVLAKNSNGMITDGILKKIWDHGNLRRVKVKEKGIPFYYKNHIIEKENSVIEKENGNTFNFAFTTDNHIQEHTHMFPLYSHNILNKLKNSLNIEFVLNGGDSVPFGRDEKNLSLEALKTGINKYIDKKNYFNAQGNHDTNAKSGVSNHLLSNIITQNEIYKILGKHLDRSVTWGDKGYMYYFKDLEELKIRIIVLNNSDVPIEDNGSGKTTIDILETLGMRQHQINWLANTALKFDDKSDKDEWEVILLSHYFTTIEDVHGGAEWHNRTQVHEILKAFVNGTSTTQTNDDSIFNLNVNADFTHQGPKKIIGYFCGHCHYDFLRVVDGIPFISSQADYKSNWHPKCPNMESGTFTEIAFDIITLDKVNKNVKLTRFGAGNDREYNY